MFLEPIPTEGHGGGGRGRWGEGKGGGETHAEVGALAHLGQIARLGFQQERGHVVLGRSRVKGVSLSPPWLPYRGFAFLLTPMINSIILYSCPFGRRIRSLPFLTVRERRAGWVPSPLPHSLSPPPHAAQIIASKEESKILHPCSERGRARFRSTRRRPGRVRVRPPPPRPCPPLALIFFSLYECILLKSIFYKPETESSFSFSATVCSVLTPLLPCSSPLSSPPLSLVFFFI